MQKQFKKLKLDVATVKKVLGEMFTLQKDGLDNEKDNEHSQNALELAKKYAQVKKYKDETVIFSCKKVILTNQCLIYKLL